ncbi:TetR/AcrR family transcriptional regulator [Sphingobium mellinum]|uniref:TetR/AcrR family transcriptional regulator n=1 Tax=Sphingobium mellinum TaxID=1387166 RepID=UPI0030ED30FE
MTKKQMAKDLSTKEAMIVAAERRFALNGMEGTSMRQIAIDAGQRNESAAHYHFGSREGLIRAILSYRIATLNARRQQLLQQARDRREKLISPREIASIFILPMADEIFLNWRNCYWVRFISHLWSIEKFQYLASEFESSSSALTEANDLLRTIPGVDPMILEVRRTILRRDVVWGLSRVEAMSFHESREMCELHVANLVDMIAAGISVPPSQDTIVKANAVDATRAPALEMMRSASRL